MTNEELELMLEYCRRGKVIADSMQICEGFEIDPSSLTQENISEVIELTSMKAEIIADLFGILATYFVREKQERLALGASRWNESVSPILYSPQEG